MKLTFVLLTLVFVITTLLAPLSALADLTKSNDSVAQFPATKETLFQKYFRDLYAPYVNPSTLAIFAGGTVSTLTLLATHKDFEDPLLENVSTTQPLGGSSTIGDIAGQMVPNVLYAGYNGLSYYFSKNPLAETRMEMMIRSTLSATTLSTILKLSVREPRPKNDSELTSFPSGHATSIFAFATTVAAMHGIYWGASAYALAAFVGFSRMNDNRHRLHDVVAGATIGSMYGLAVYHRMKEETEPSPQLVKQFRYDVTPVAIDDGGYLSLSATF